MNSQEFFTSSYVDSYVRFGNRCLLQETGFLRLTLVLNTCSLASRNYPRSRWLRVSHKIKEGKMRKNCRFKRILVRKVLFDFYVHHQLFVNLHTSDMQFLIACSKRSDSGERSEVKKAMKSRGGLGREVLTGVPPLTSLAFIFSRSFLLRTAPHYLNAWNRLSSRKQKDIAKVRFQEALLRRQF